MNEQQDAVHTSEEFQSVLPTDAELSSPFDSEAETCAAWPVPTQDEMAPVGPLRISIPVQHEMRLLSTHAQLNRAIAVLCAILALMCLALLVLFVAFLNERRTTRTT